MNAKILILFSILILSSPNCKKKTSESSNIDSGRAVVFFIKGSVSIKDPSGNQLPIEPKVTRIASDHSIETSKSAYIDILLADASIVRVYENTKLKIQSIIDTSANRENSKILLTSGKLFVKTDGKLKKDHAIQVNTPTTVAGVRGTEFTIEEAADQTTVLVGEGSVEGGSLDGEAKVVNAGQKLEVENNQADVSSMNREELESFKEESQSVASIVADGQADIQKILQNFQEEKSKILKTMEDKKDENKKLIDDKKASDQILINEQKEKNKEQMGNVKSETLDKASQIKDTTSQEKDKIQGDAKSEMEKLKAGFKDK